MNLDQIKAEYLREKEAGVPGSGERLLERHPEHFDALLLWLIEFTAPERALARAQTEEALFQTRSTAQTKRRTA